MMKLKDVCKDCKGSGQYVGLCSVDKCQLCDGVGYIEELITLDQYISFNNPVNEDYNSCDDEDENKGDFELLYEMWLDSIDAQTNY